MSAQSREYEEKLKKKKSKNVEWIKKQSSAYPNHPVSYVALVLSGN